MKKDDKVYIAGHGGLVGGAIWNVFRHHGYTNLIGKTHAELDLTCQSATDDFFVREKPDYVVLAAARVGGIKANNQFRAQFIYDNLMIQNNVIHAAYRHDVKKMLFLGSSCIYPKLAEQPIREAELLTGPLEPTNEPYAIAKIAGIRLCDAYNRQYGTNFISAMPTNLYGPADNYHPHNSHVLPAIIRKMHLAHLLERGDFKSLESICSGENSTDDNIGEQVINAWLGESGIAQGRDGVTLTLWGTGNPLREFLYSSDLAEACLFLMESVGYGDIAFTDDSGTVQAHINVGSGKEARIKEIATLVKDIVGFGGKVEWDSQKPDGTPRKLMDSSRIMSLGWQPRISLDDGIKMAYEDFKMRCRKD